MNLNYSEEQTMLREQIQKFCETEYDFYKREDVVKSDNDFDENVWALFAEKGIDNQPCSAKSAQTLSSKSLSDLTTPSLL